MDYSPYGLNINGIEKQGQPNNRFQYNGKEKQEEFDLAWTDFGQRMQDPQLGRFHNIDRFAEKYIDANPYHYTLNNPIKYREINGDSIIFVNNNQVLTQKMNSLRKGSKMFDELYKRFEKSSNLNASFEINDEKVDKTADRKGVRRESVHGYAEDGTGVIVLRSTMKDKAIIEEFFHQFQSNFYKGSRSEPQIEAEAKLFDNVALSELISNDVGVSVTSGMSGNEEGLIPSCSSCSF